MFRVFAPLRQAVKLTTGITGLPVHENPIPALTQTYRSTLALLQKDVPESSVYRQSVEALTQHRLSILENAKEDDVLKLIGAAEREYHLVEKMDRVESVSGPFLANTWEPLEEKPAPGQWKYFD
ncbi:hypothetical protein BS47DRAFT_1345210 [Hydnum rufescens UP504]|uniref:Uncharacterized protein n=1 Tax=Hydnum rufescens UP504 TaxID=1448309 RepID=A0A9P6AVL7_9AGAM|nr:hypothetical protein BS47DRAFT_1345210 [Hydnum rufescens UP504]